MRLDAFGICLLKQTASSAQSVASPSKIEGFREFEADLSDLFHTSRIFTDLMWIFVEFSVNLLDRDVNRIL